MSGAEIVMISAPSYFLHFHVWKTLPKLLSLREITLDE